MVDETSNELGDIEFEPEYEEVKTFHKMASLKLDVNYRIVLPKMLRELLDVNRDDYVQIGFNSIGDII